MDLKSYINLTKNKTKIIHIVASWCLACNINNALLDNYKDDIIEIDFDKYPEIIKHENIQKVPTIIWENHKIEGVSSFKLKKLLKSFDQQLI